MVVAIVCCAGADLNGNVEWKTPNNFDKWTLQEWNSWFRWLSTCCYQSYLDFALTESKVKPFNAKGGRIVLKNPTSGPIFHSLRPNIDIVRLLLGRGARISLSAAKTKRALLLRALLVRFFGDEVDWDRVVCANAVSTRTESEPQPRNQLVLGR